jgi:hypothetical protein
LALPIARLLPKSDWWFGISEEILN